MGSVRRNNDGTFTYFTGSGQYSYAYRYRYKDGEWQRQSALGIWTKSAPPVEVQLERERVNSEAIAKKARELQIAKERAAGEYRYSYMGRSFLYDANTKEWWEKNDMTGGYLRVDDSSQLPSKLVETMNRDYATEEERIRATKAAAEKASLENAAERLANNQAWDDIVTKQANEELNRNIGGSKAITETRHIPQVKEIIIYDENGRTVMENHPITSTTLPEIKPKFAGHFTGDLRSYQARKQWVADNLRYLQEANPNIDWSNYTGTAQLNMALKGLIGGAVDWNAQHPAIVARDPYTNGQLMRMTDSQEINGLDEADNTRRNDLLRAAQENADARNAALTRNGTLYLDEAGYNAAVDAAYLAAAGEERARDIAAMQERFNLIPGLDLENRTARGQRYANAIETIYDRGNLLNKYDKFNTDDLLLSKLDKLKWQEAKANGMSWKDFTAKNKLIRLQNRDIRLNNKIVNAFATENPDLFRTNAERDAYYVAPTQYQIDENATTFQYPRQKNGGIINYSKFFV